MNIDVKDIPAKLQPVLNTVKENIVFVLIMAVLIMYGLLVLQIRHLATIEPSNADITKKVNELNTPKLDNDAVNKILQLEDKNIEVKTLFNEARDNPFQE